MDGGVVVLAILAVGAAWCVLWQIFVEEPRQRARQARREKWLKRQREEELGLWYGDDHKALKVKYQEEIDAGGGRCMERICVMPTRRIAPGEFWHLAHDHVKGGPLDYLGPAHPECNEAEARSRGVRFENSYRPPSGTYYSATRNGDPWADGPQPVAPRDDDEWWKREPPDDEDPRPLNPASTLTSAAKSKSTATTGRVRPTGASLGSAADVEHMKTLIDLHNEGVISRTEFDAARARLVAPSDDRATTSSSSTTQRETAQRQSVRERNELLDRAASGTGIRHQEQRDRAQVHQWLEAKAEEKHDRAQVLRRLEAEAEKKRQERERRFNDMLKSPTCAACGRIPEPFSGQCGCR